MKKSVKTVLTYSISPNTTNNNAMRQVAINIFKFTLQAFWQIKQQHLVCQKRIRQAKKRAVLLEEETVSLFLLNKNLVPK